MFSKYKARRIGKTVGAFYEALFDTILGNRKNIVVKDNVMRGNGGGIHVAGQTGARKPMPVDSHRNIKITGNRISGSAPGISVVGCTGLDVRGNEIELPAGAKTGALALSNVADVQKD